MISVNADFFFGNIFNLINFFFCEEINEFLFQYVDDSYNMLAKLLVIYLRYTRVIYFS